MSAGGIGHLIDLYRHFDLPPLKFIANKSDWAPAGDNSAPIETVAAGIADVSMEYWFITETRMKEISYGYPWLFRSGIFIYASKVLQGDSRYSIRTYWKVIFYNRGAFKFNYARCWLNKPTLGIRIPDSRFRFEDLILNSVSIKRIREVKDCRK